MITTLIGHVANANGIDLTVTASAVSPVISILDLQGHWRQTFGYLAETNFAFYFLVIAPLLVFLAFQFLLSSGYALFNFERNGILRIGKVNPSDQPPRLKFISRLKRWLFVILRIDRGHLNDQTPPLKFISRLNHSLFVIPLYSPVLIIPACWYVQFSSLDNVSHGYPTPQGDAWELGHVQSPYLPTWLSFFNNPHLNDADRLSILQRGKHVDDVASALLEEVSSKGQQAIRDFRPVLHFEPDSPEQPTNLALDEAIRHGMIRLHASASGYPKVDSPSQMAWFRVFVAMSQVQVGMLFAFEFWILFKVIFWLALLWYLLPRKEEEQRFKLDPQRGTAADPKLTDRDKSFGLSALFRPYDIIVFMIALGAFYYALQIPNQTGVRAMLVDPATGSLWTRLLHLFALLITISVMVIGPIVGFAVIMGRWQKRRVKQLEEEEQRTDERRKNEIPAEIELVNAQTTWPKRDKLFWAALFTVVVSVGPVVAQFAGVPESVRRFISVPGAVKYTVHTSVRKAYGLDNLDVKGE